MTRNSPSQEPAASHPKPVGWCGTTHAKPATKTMATAVAATATGYWSVTTACSSSSSPNAALASNWYGRNAHCFGDITSLSLATATPPKSCVQMIVFKHGAYWSYPGQHKRLVADGPT